MDREKRFALLIDADNVSDKYIKVVLDELSNDGIATYRRIYGDWTHPRSNGWKSVLLDYSVQPIQQYSYTSGKNATDSAMIIDAMDILYSGSVDGFCIVSSDSDFTRLASRLREAGMMVIGMGETKTPKPFIAACNKFRYLDILAKDCGCTLNTDKGSKKKQDDLPLQEVISEIRSIVEENSDEDGWMPLSATGLLLAKRSPDFDVRNFGFRKLSEFTKSLSCVETRSECVRENEAPVVYIKIKE